MDKHITRALLTARLFLNRRTRIQAQVDNLTLRVERLENPTVTWIETAGNNTEYTHIHHHWVGWGRLTGQPYCADCGALMPHQQPPTIT